MAAFYEFGVIQEDIFACVAVELGRARVYDDAFSIEVEDFCLSHLSFDISSGIEYFCD